VIWDSTPSPRFQTSTTSKETGAGSHATERLLIHHRLDRSDYHFGVEDGTRGLNPNVVVRGGHLARGLPKVGYRVIDMSADYFEDLPEALVFPQRSSSQIEELFRELLPEKGQNPDAILHDWMACVLPNVTHIGSPRYFGLVNGSGREEATRHAGAAREKTS